MAILSEPTTATIPYGHWPSRYPRREQGQEATVGGRAQKGKGKQCSRWPNARYMGYVQEELAEEGQTVVGVIIALEDDKKLRRALTMTPNITFYRYQISFKLVKA